MFTSPGYNLFEPVVEALRSQGHDVTVIFGDGDSDDPRMLDRRIKLSKKRIQGWKDRLDSYWKKQENIVAKGYDIFISLSGSSFDETSFRLIEKYSPGIEKVIFTWDSFNFFDFRQMERFFDRKYTFDIVDAENPGWKLLPSFYVRNDEQRDRVENEYDVFMIGSNHDRRYTFIRKILPVLKSNGLNSYIKIVSPYQSWKSLNFVIDCIKTLYIRGHFSELLFSYGYTDRELRLYDPVGLEEFTDIMNRSKCILDDNRESQAGLSPRFIRAVALGKKIITTNEWAYQFSFVDKNNVMIVDKKKPALDIDFIRQPARLTQSKDFEALELSNWVRILTGEVDCPSFRAN